MNDKTQTCECGEKLDRMYFRSKDRFTSLNMFYCQKCGSVYEQKLNKKKVKLSQKNSRKLLKRKSV